MTARETAGFVISLAVFAAVAPPAAPRRLPCPCFLSLERPALFSGGDGGKLGSRRSAVHGCAGSENKKLKKSPKIGLTNFIFCVILLNGPPGYPFPKALPLRGPPFSPEEALQRFSRQRHRSRRPLVNHHNQRIEEYGPTQGAPVYSPSIGCFFRP